MSSSKLSSMGTIVSTKIREDNKVQIELVVDCDEWMQLKGNLNDVHVFSDGIADIKANISQRGKNSATKYFLIPKELRAKLNFDENTKCQKIDTKTKSIFVYVVDKLSGKKK